MYIESVPNRGSPPAILLRESFRDQGRVRKRTVANLSGWPTALVEGFRTLLKGGVAVAADGIRIRRALPHGHAAAVLGMIRAIGLDRLLGKPTGKRLVPLAIALIASRLVSPASKLATARELAADTAASSLGRLLGLGAVDEVELYRALDWLGARQGAIETALARRHLKDGALVLYDVSSSPAFAGAGSGSKAGAASWRASATHGTARRANCRSSMACCARPMAARWRSKSSKATPPTR